ncbi:MAG: DoxX family protein, partial [Gammaproteobacteria bacterium]|nr:DoxX family protein [Gammaproteobacteria bacterium]
MSVRQTLDNLHETVFGWTRKISWLGPLALRLYLAPVFWVAGMNKASGFDNVVQWFGNDDWGLGLPLPGLMAFLATATEILGGVLLLLGLATRWVTVPLIITMIVAATTVHWENGWQAVHDAQSPYASQYTLGIEADDVAAAGQKLEQAKEILQQNGDYAWLTEQGSFVVSNSGVEWAVTYLVMLLALLFTGAGSASLDRLL